MRSIGKESEMSMLNGRNGSSGRHRVLCGVGVRVLLLASLGLVGCSMFVPGPQVQIEIEPTLTPTVTPTLTPTWPPAWTATPTFTPWPPTATPTPTFTPIPTSTPLPPGVTPVRPRARPSGPLTIDFELNGKWCADAGYIAEFTVMADGGGGGYTYYRDIIPIGGPTDGAVTHRLHWLTCGGAPGTFFVESADGQKASKLFWVHPPSCCKED